MKRTLPRLLILALLALLASAPLQAEGTAMPADCPMHAQHMAAAAGAATIADPVPEAPKPSPYAGEKDRQVAGLPAEEAVALRAGTGHGMALPAELHHYPGPRHALDMATELRLSAAQREALFAIYDRMHSQALALGAKILAGESELDDLFRDGQPTAMEVERLTLDLGRLRGALRAVHLGAHVATRALLSPDQVARYDSVRGYAVVAPAGHAPH